MVTYGIGDGGKEISVRNGSVKQSTRLSFTKATLFCTTLLIHARQHPSTATHKLTHFGYAPAFAKDHPLHAPTYPFYVGAHGDVYIVTNGNTMLHDRGWLARKTKALVSFGLRIAGAAWVIQRQTIRPP